VFNKFFQKKNGQVLQIEVPLFILLKIHVEELLKFLNIFNVHDVFSILSTGIFELLCVVYIHVTNE